MTSSEIREDLFTLFDQIDESVGVPLERTIAKAKIKMMAEIAAQLADLNANILSFDYKDGTRILDVRTRQE